MRASGVHPGRRGSSLLIAAPSQERRDSRADRSDELCREAVRGYERLYRWLDCDEPDVGANIGYMLCRSALERRIAAEPWDVPPERARRIRDLVATALEADDPHLLSSLFSGFPGFVLSELERRMPHAGSAGSRHPHARRSGDRS